jgi:hypothetical protein
MIQRGFRNMIDFQALSPDEKLSYAIDNLKNIPPELVSECIDLLVQANEIEYAAVLARDNGYVHRAIQILVDAGDYLWAGLIAKNAGLIEDSDRIYREGLDYYIEMEMFGRAVSAATILKLPPDTIDALFRKGIETESRGMDLQKTREMLDLAMESLEISLMDRGDQISKEVCEAIRKRRDSKLDDKSP